MGEIPIADLAKRFLEAGVDKVGAEEGGSSLELDELNGISKYIHDHSLQDPFQKEVYRQISISSSSPISSYLRSEFFEATQRRGIHLSPENIIPTIFKDELGGAELKRAEDFYFHGKDRHRSNFFERISEIFLPDLSSTSSKILFLSVRLLNYFPQPIKTPIFLSLTLFGLYNGMRLICTGLHQYFQSTKKLEKEEAVANVVGGVFVGAISTLSLFSKGIRFFKSSLNPNGSPQGKLARFHFRKRPSQFNSSDPLSHSLHSFSRPESGKGRFTFQAFFGTVALDLQRAAGVIFAIRPRKNNLILLPLSLRQRLRLRVRDLEQQISAKKWLSFLDPVTGKLKSHAQLILEEFQKNIFLSKELSPFDLRMSSDESKPPSDLSDKSKDEKEKPHLHVVREGEVAALEAPDLTHPPHFLSHAEYLEQWVEWGMSSFTSSEVLTFSRAAMSPTVLFDTALEKIGEVEGVDYFLRRIGKQRLGRKDLTIEGVQEDDRLRNIFLKDLIRLPVVRESLLKELVKSPVLRGELVAYFVKRSMDDPFFNSSISLQDQLVEKVRKIVEFSFSYLDIFALLVFIQSLEEKSKSGKTYKKIFEEKFGIVLAPSHHWLLKTEDLNPYPFSMIGSDLPGYQMTLSDSLRSLLLEQLSPYLEGAPSPEMAYFFLSERPDLFADGFAWMFNQRFGTLEEDLVFWTRTGMLKNSILVSRELETEGGRSSRENLINTFHQMSEIHRALIQGNGSYFLRFLAFALYGSEFSSNSILTTYPHLFRMNEWVLRAEPNFARQWRIPQLLPLQELEKIASGQRNPLPLTPLSERLRVLIEEMRRSSRFSKLVLEKFPPE